MCDIVNIVLCGFKGCGKSYLGQRVAERLGFDFIDTDLLIEQLFLKMTGEAFAIRTICQKYGEKAFRGLESLVLSELVGVKNSVIALGGGAILSEENRNLIKRLGIVVYLEVEKALLKDRLLKNELPTFLEPSDPSGSFERMYQERLPLYKGVADYKIVLGNNSEGGLNRVYKKICILVYLHQKGGGLWQQRLESLHIVTK